MRRQALLLTLLATICFSCAQKVGDAIPYNSYAKYPLLNTSEKVTVYGDAEVPLEELKKSGTAYHKAPAMQYSALCKIEKYACSAVAVPEGQDQWPVYALDSKNVKEKAPGSFELTFPLDGAKRIESAIIYLPPRPETGLLAAEIRLIDAVMRTFAGQSVNKTMLNKCYQVNKEDMREKCVVQSPKVNGRQYQVTVNFLNLDHQVGQPLKPNPQADLRSFSVKILPVKP